MGERKGVNKYYPPDFDYKKHGSLDKYHNSHPLRERAKKLGEGILIIRFEMPYNIWCNGCNKHIGMGVRYNSEKKRVGYYYTTPIYKFRMKCHLCVQHFEIQTDPANCEYVILSGARRKEERWDAKDNEQIEMTDHMDKKKLATDAMFKLEHNVKDQRKLMSALPTLEEIQDIQEEKKDDYLLNKALRKRFRETKKALEATSKSDQALLNKSSLAIKLLPEDERDRNIARLMKYNAAKSFDEKQEEIRKEISSKPVIESSSKVEEVRKVASKLPNSLGTALIRSSVKTDLWDAGSGQRITLGKRPHMNNLGIKILKRRKSEEIVSLNSGSSDINLKLTDKHAEGTSEIPKSVLREELTDKNRTISQKPVKDETLLVPGTSLSKTFPSIRSLVAEYSDSSEANSDLDTDGAGT